MMVAIVFPVASFANDVLDFRGVRLGMTIEQINSLESVRLGYMPRLLLSKPPKNFFEGGALPTSDAYCSKAFVYYSFNEKANDLSKEKPLF